MASRLPDPRGWIKNRLATRRTREPEFVPKLVALDIDGTLVDAYGAMPDEVQAAVRRVVDAGVPVVLSTGRSWLATQLVFDQLGLPPGWAVASNGGLVVTYPPFEVHHETHFDPGPVIRQVAEIAPHARVAVQEGLHWRATQEFPEGELLGEVRIETFEELAAREVSRVIVRDPGCPEDVFRQMVSRLGLHEVAYFIGWSAWLDIAPPGVDKASGLELVCDRLGLTAGDVLAIGDGRNDIEMLRWAGRGVAMGDAEVAVAAAANAITGTFEELGVATELARWFPEG